MKTNRLLMLLAAVGIIIVGYNIYNDRMTSPEPVGEVTSGESIESEIEQILGREISDDLRKTEITNQDARAVVTFDDSSGQNRLSILADLPAKEGESSSYIATISKGEQRIELGQLSSVKGGYVLEQDIGVDPNEYNNLEITSGEDTILQGILDL